jgi:hypothetical protein
MGMPAVFSLRWEVQNVCNYRRSCCAESTSRGREGTGADQPLDEWLRDTTDGAAAA